MHRDIISLTKLLRDEPQRATKAAATNFDDREAY